MGKLTTLKVRHAKPGRHIDGDGLCLVVKQTGAKSWVLRVQVDGKRRDIGLGSVDTGGVGRGAYGTDSIPLMLRTSLTLEEAREKAAALRRQAKAGADPIVERDRERKPIPTFAEAVIAAHKALAPGWVAKNAEAFKTSLETHANPALGKLKVNAIGARDVIAALAPIWNDKPGMARKVRIRIGQVLAFAKSHGWRTDAPPDARELSNGLSKQKTGGNFKAMAYCEVPAFFADQLAKDHATGRMALLFAILTASRSGEVRNAKWEQVDLKARTWSRPAEIMKLRKAHVVTLSGAAVALLERMAPEGKRAGLIFPGTKGPLSDMSISKVMRLAGRDETVHGFRSSFRDWAAEQMPTVPAMVAEMALAHSVGTTTEKAYLRSDLRDMRFKLMDAWGRYAAPSLSGIGSNVVRLTGQKPA